MKTKIVLNRKIVAMFCKVLFETYRKNRLLTIGYFAGALVEIGGFLVSLYATAKLGGLLATYRQGINTDEIWFWLAIDIGATTLTAAAFWLMGFTRGIIYYATVQQSINDFQRTVCNLDIASFYDSKTRNLLNKVQDGYSYKLANAGGNALQTMYGIVRLLATAIVVAQINVLIILIVLVFLIPNFIVETKRSKNLWFIWDKKGDEKHIFWGLEWILRQADSQMEMRGSQAREYIMNKVQTINNVFYGEQKRVYKRSSFLSLPANIIENAGIAIGLIYLLKQFLSFAISLERYFFLSAALLRIGSALSGLLDSLTRMQDDLLYTESFYKMIEMKPKIVDKPHAVAISDKTVPEIEFRDVWFTYPGQTKPVFKGLSFIISPGQHLAIVGENGAGKSTLIKLLLRFYLPDKGGIYINGVDLNDIEIESWYGQFSTLLQDFNRYPFSIEENVTMANDNLGMKSAHFREATKNAELDSVVKGLPHGWETVLDNSFEKGTEPSGGQWQRVALARTFYRNANVLVLDEPTAAIDAKAEYNIFNNLFRSHSSKSIIIVSHRFSTVRKADTIFVIADGAIIEQGSHAELIKLEGTYKRMFDMQAEGYLN